MADTPTHAINYWSGKCLTCLTASTAPAILLASMAISKPMQYLWGVVCD